ncbi:Crp/Fnr family transcriptional regulator [Streptomyces botrytidirepellens]|uniref:Crp/Fnr family transcriptional regulator n=1 Tax=Streptomyces botrytidirepellens TaxID=2486417 RepID=A0A3M8WTR8_9ACTN|nr:Crp/Fnr family transcriptional regulator [Streptomyces botrytidirepellens]RNG33552.1 Crp/Fnr family transcriptional regulator [Streptomyces botrytidirepellens]
MGGSVSADTPAAGWRLLGEVPLLAGLPEERLRALWAASAQRTCPAGQVLAAAGEPAGYLPLLLRGSVAATGTTASGRVVRFGQWSGPCALDKIAVIDGRGHTATFTALTPCTVRRLRRDRFLALVEDPAPDAAPVRGHVLRVLAGQARRQQERFMATATGSAEARLAAWLLEEAATAAGGRVPLPGTQAELGHLLGVTRVTVNRALARLRRDGLIEVGPRSVTVLAPELLGRRAAG